MNKKNIVMITPSNFPNGDAGSVRDLAFANIYESLGYNVSLISNGQKIIDKFDNIICYSLYREKKGLLSKINDYISYKKRMIIIIDKIIEMHGKPDVIHFNDIPFPAIQYLKKIGKKNNIKLIHDSTEWYSACEFKFGILDKSYILKNILNRFVINKRIRVIAISSYLQSYFQRKGIESVRIPVIMNIESNKVVNKDNNNINIAYAGSPANKDNLKIIINTFNNYSKELDNKVLLHIIGISEKEAKKKYKISKFSNCITFYGRITRNEVKNILKNMDYTILIRPSKERYTKAGFPTKVVESLSLGVPVITNYSSDLWMYLKNNYNSIIIQGNNPQDIIEYLYRIMNLDKKEMTKMKKNAYKTAKENFDVPLWKGVMEELLRR